MRAPGKAVGRSLLRLAAAVVFATLVTLAGGSTVGACALTTDLSGLTGGDATTTDSLHLLGGTVVGLEGAKVTLVNADDYVDVDADGPFTFKKRIAAGVQYVVKVNSTSDGRACRIDNAEGLVTNADVTNVKVLCPSSNAELTSLTLSCGPLSPTFTSSGVKYTAATFEPDLFALDQVPTLTATTASPSATVTLNDVVVPSGKPARLGDLRAGPNTIAVDVRAADGVATTRYTIDLAENFQEAYVKSSNARKNTLFGSGVALSVDGSTMVVGASNESSIATGVDGDQTDQPSLGSGAAYVFRRAGTAWAQEAYLKASNTGPLSMDSPMQFGFSTALSSDGNTLAIGAPGERSASPGINGDQTDRSAPRAGAVYVFRRSGTGWAQEAYVKASNARRSSDFGSSVALSSDGNTLAVGAEAEQSLASGINGNQTDVTGINPGAVFVFRRAGTTWQQEAYVKASNTILTAQSATFGRSVALSSDGNTLAVGGPLEDGGATGINGDQTDASMSKAGAVYVFTRSVTTWTQEAYVKASNTAAASHFGSSVSLAADGSSLLVGAEWESSSQSMAGAAYFFKRSKTTWAQHAFVQASTLALGAEFGNAVALSADGQRALIGSGKESGSAAGINGSQSDQSASYSGAVYTFTPTSTGWGQAAYVKASFLSPDDLFGFHLALSGDGHTFAVGAINESGSTAGVNGDPTVQGAEGAGAVYVFR